MFRKYHEVGCAGTDGGQHDVTVSRSTGRTGRPPVTSREQILTAARELLEREGWEKLTIRRLAAELGVGATTLYHHVQDKEDLLVQVLDYYADQIPRTELPTDPRARIIAAATVMHDELAARPWAAELLTADDFMGESALWMVEAILGGARDHGCTPEQAVDLYRNVWYYTIGEILVRAHSNRRRSTNTRPTYRDALFTDLDATRLPHITAVADRWPTLTARDTYAEGLRAFVDGLLARVGSGS
jgi:AcrR family transcriptional regulator